MFHKVSLPQVPEQIGKETFIGLWWPVDFDMYLYEILGFCILERYISTDEFKGAISSGRIDPEEMIRELEKLRDHCNRVIEKLKSVDKTKR